MSLSYRGPIGRASRYNLTVILMLLVIDNYDSFTFNLVQYLGELGVEIVVYRNDELSVEEIQALGPTHPPRTPHRRPRFSDNQLRITQPPHSRRGS